MIQGLVTVIKDDNQVFMKIVAGSNGFNARKLAERIRDDTSVLEDIERVYQLALTQEFGSTDDLVVISCDAEVFKMDEDLSDLYRKTFFQPRFNPRWESGVPEFYEKISF